MKKILFVALALLVTGTMYADKKCCKDAAKCNKETAAKACSHDQAGAKTAGGTNASLEAAAPAEMHACCKKSVAASGKACCSKGAHAEMPVPQKSDSSQPLRDDTK
jgi:hypothetical protein